MPVLETKGAISAQGFGLTLSSAEVVYIEDVFSTWLYTGNGSTQTINNGIDLTGKGGLVWLKSRSTADANGLFDTVRGVNAGYLQSEDTGAQSGSASQLTSFNANGFTLPSSGYWNQSGQNLVSWTFREQPKFFDIVTYTGTGSPRTVAHNLGSVPGCIIIKRTDAAANWIVYHRSLGNDYQLFLNLTLARNYTNEFNFTDPTSTVFSVNGNNAVNANGGTYVAYLFAHDAGGFGLSGTDNVISCGSYTGNGSMSGPVVTLGYEPQWVLVKRTDTTGNWLLQDNMRSLSQTNTDILFPNLSNAATTGAYPSVVPTATGFYIGDNGTNYNANGGTYIYIAIRRGPMKVPTTGTSVFNTVARTGTGTTATVTAGFPVDMYLMQRRPIASFPNIVDRLRSNSRNIQTYQVDAEITTTNTVTGLDSMTGAVVGADIAGYVNESGITYANQMFRRAPGFFDEVCYTGNGPGTQVVNHNLTVVPELVINKVRSTTSGWTVFQGDTTALTGFLRLNQTSAAGGDTLNVSSTTITVDSTIGFGMNTSGQTYVTYLFASCPGVSKVGRFTGTGATQVINCGFTGGARFVLIKARSTTGEWYVWDSARGIVAGNDPYLALNSTAAEVTNTDWVDTAATGFELSNNAGNLANSNGVTYIFLAIA